MNNKYIKIRIFTALIASSLYSKAATPVTHYTIQPNSPEQHIQHFGASDAWSMQFLGLWPQKQQEQIADWLFSLDTDAQGKPKGIGLSLWRFNLGAGSEEQGETSQIQRGTRTQCFLKADGTYDWNKQEGQRRFLKLAKQRGVPYLLAFCNSAPVYFTKNGLATNTGRDGTINLKDNCYDDFARFMATSLKGIEEHDGIHIDYISPVNEPDGHWNWLGPKQEGSPATNREIAHVVRELNKELLKRKVNTKILMNESSDYRCLLGTHHTDWQRGYEIKAFFTKDSTQTYIGNQKTVLPLIGAHSYWTNTPIPYMREARMQVREACKQKGIKFWQTEICIMSNDEEIGGGNGYDYSMKTALYVARIIHHDLVYANAESWSWWRAAGGDYRDGLLRIYSNDGWKSGWAVDSKLLWTMGNYSRFIRPGAQRYDISTTSPEGKNIPEGYNDPKGVMCSAYRNTDGKWVVVAINYSEDIKPVNFTVQGEKDIIWTPYRTSDRSAENLLPLEPCTDDILLAPRSVTTFVQK
ncbi:glycoside hydrolase [Segatella albensis]|uniref:glycoside hydrolase n=1 Tax=Segatella albensis TaxID=77768 RepID=UPI0004102DF9|nr:glycoside hydrolase [Segatella albensis]